MSSIGDKALERPSKPQARRPRDAEATRTALLAAAREVFVELGYERATTRRIGERAGVDPALIARYFEGKEGLFMAAIATMAAGEHDVDLTRTPSSPICWSTGTSAATARSAAPSPAPPSVTRCAARSGPASRSCC